jgi:hypothetical protein
MKYLPKAALGVAVLLLLFLGVAYPHGENDRDDHDQSRVRRGFQIAPVNLNLKGKNPALVGLGSYIVNAQGSCADCHSCPTYAAQHNPYFGEPKGFNTTNYLAGGVHFGPFTSANLTPDGSGHPAGLTLKDFIATIRTGHNPNDPPGEILQVMPWPVMQDMTDRDLHAIYEYLSAIPPAPSGTNCTGAGQ